MRLLLLLRLTPLPLLPLPLPLPLLLPLPPYLLPLLTLLLLVSLPSLLRCLPLLPRRRASQPTRTSSRRPGVQVGEELVGRCRAPRGIFLLGAAVFLSWSI